MRFTTRFMFISCLGILSFHGLSQKFYVTLQAGYAIGVDGEEYYYDYYKERTSETYATSKSLSFNSGLKGGLRAGWIFNNRMGFDADLIYTKGVKEISYLSTVVSQNGGSNKDRFDVNLLWNANTFSFKPALRIEAGKKSITYLRVGPSINRISITEVLTAKASGANGIETQEMETEFATTWALGAFFELGFEFQFNETMKVMTSVSYDAASFRPKSSEVVMYNENGEDRLSDLLTYQKEMVYVDEVNLSTPVYPTVPYESNKVKLGFSAISVNIGLKLDLN